MTPRRPTWTDYGSFAQLQLDWRDRDLRTPEEPEHDRSGELPDGSSEDEAIKQNDRGKARPTTLKRERAADENLALQMRGAHVQGNVDLKPDNRAAMWHDRDEALGDYVSNALAAACRCHTYNEHTCKEIDSKCTCNWRHTNNGWPRRPSRTQLEPIVCNCRELKEFWEKRRKEKYAYVHNAYVNGQILLEGAKVHGDLNLKGILANLHNAVPVDRSALYAKNTAFLKIERADIRGSLELNESVGVRGIEAQHVRIGARIRFARHSVRIGDVDEHALLIGGKLQLSDARIGGDATFLFDKNEGPSLLLARAQIGGRLTILPAKWVRIEPVKTVHHRRTLENAIITSAEPGVPEIDLRAGRAAELGHVEQAWPRQDYLRLEGFLYEQSSNHGPLSPRSRDLAEAPYEDDTPPAAIAVEAKPAPADRWEALSQQEVWLWLAAAAFSFVAAVIIASLAGVLQRVDEGVGLWNIALFTTCALFWAGRSVVARFSEPKKKDAEPRAVYWLGLQRASTSVYQLRGLTIPLQPYVQAGRVLRSAGLILSANLLEVDRLSRRNEQLSWRNNWPSKILLGIANLSTKYGFDPLRTVVIAVLIGSAAACVFHDADRGGFIRPVDGDLLALAATKGDLFAGMDCNEHAAGCAARSPPKYPSFSSLFFAFDVMTPGLDVGQEQYWRASATNGAGERSYYDLLAPILKIIGWLLTTAIAISLLTRVEAMIARHEE